MMESRKKIFIFLSIVVLFVLAFLLVFLFLRKPAAPAPVENPLPIATTTPVETPPAPIAPVKNTPPPPPATTEEREKLYVKQLSRTFVERFETYSNQNKNRNFDDAAALATDNMASYIISKSQVQSTEYQGVTTKVISMEVTAFSADTATVKIGAQVENQTSTSSQTSYKNGRVELKKIDDTWKVSGLFWDLQ